MQSTLGWYAADVKSRASKSLSILILFVFFEYFDCTENIVRILICKVTWKIKPFSILFALVVDDEVHEGIVRRS